MERGFSKADVNTLPKVDFYMVQHFLSTNDKFRDANKNGKIQRSRNPHYLQTAIGRVQYKVEGDIFTLKAKVVPEHRVTSRKYNVVAIINTLDEEIVDVFCESTSDGCKAAAGGCKHAVAFLFFLYEKHSQPSPTDSSCLWKMPQLSNVDVNIDNFNLKNYNSSGITSNVTAPPVTGSGRFLQTLLSKCPKHVTTGCLKYRQLNPNTRLYILHCFMIDFKKLPNVKKSVTGFDRFCKSKMKRTVCTEIEQRTRGQNNGLWHLLKFGRITASKIWDLSRCSTSDGTLVRSVMGQQTVMTEAMERGLQLEEKVVKIIQKRYKNVTRCGLFLNPDYAMFGASPDAINETTVFEIKCPSREENIKYYVNDDGQLKNKVLAQIQLQILLTERENGILVIVAPEFDRARNPERHVKFYSVDQDLHFTTEIMQKSFTFWRENIFPKLWDQF